MNCKQSHLYLNNFIKNPLTFVAINKIWKWTSVVCYKNNSSHKLVSVYLTWPGNLAQECAVWKERWGRVAMRQYLVVCCLHCQSTADTTLGLSHCLFSHWCYVQHGRWGGNPVIIATGRRSNDKCKPPVILPALYCLPHLFVSLTHPQCGWVLTSAWCQLHVESL